MSRLFNSATPDYFQRSAVITGYPHTQVGWFRTDDALDDTQPCFGHEQSGTDNFFKSRFEIVSVQYAFIAEQTTPNRSADANTTTSPVVDTWHHVASVAAANNDIRSFLDGAGKGTSTSPVVDPKSIDTSTIGRLDDGSPQHFSGNGSHVAIWDVALTDGEIATLASGVSPLRVRRGSLIHYWPMNGSGDGSVEIDIIGGASMTKFGTPSIDFEPPIPHSIIAP